MTVMSAVETTSDKVLFERRRAMCGLLRNPLLRVNGDSAEEYHLVRRHFKWLKHWFASFPAWDVDLDRERIRLRKLPPDFLDDTRPAIDPTSGTAFSRRRYACLCLVLAALEEHDGDATLIELAQAVILFASEDDGLMSAIHTFNPGQYDHRRDIVAAVRFLVSLGVLSRRDGDEQQFLSGDMSADVRYDIHRRTLASILQTSQSLSVLLASTARALPVSTEERASALGGDPVPVTADDRQRGLRSRLVRILLEDAVLYYRDLDPEERQYLEIHRGFLLRELCEATGLIAEIRAEGIALLDETGELTDLQLGEDNLGGQVNLLLVQWLSELARNDPDAAVPIPVVEQYVRDAICKHQLGWQHADPAGAESRMAQECLSQLQSLRLVQLSADTVIPLAACARYVGTGEE